MRLNLFSCIVAGTAAITALTLQPDPAMACNEDGYIGSICWTASPYCPREYLPANGGEYSTNDYPELYSVIKDSYGPTTKYWTFKVPDIGGREPVGIGTGPGLIPVYNYAPLGGPEQKYITSYQLPAHDHGVTITADSDIDVEVQAGAGSERTPAGNALAAPAISSILLYSNTANGEMASGVVTANISGQKATTAITPTDTQTKISVGGPQLGMLACIRLYGTYPTRR